MFTFEELAADPGFQALSPIEQFRKSDQYFSMLSEGIIEPGSREFINARTKFRQEIIPKLKIGRTPVDEMGFAERVGRGAVAGMEDIGLGAAQLGVSALETMGVEGAGERGEAMRREAKAQASRNKPLYDTVGGTIGQVLPAVALPGSTIPRAVAAGAAYGAAQPETEKGQRLENTLKSAAGFGAGNLAARGIGKVASKVISPLRGSQKATPIQAERTKSANEAQELGFNVSTGGRSGNRFVRGVESVLEDIPVTSYRARNFKEGNQARANQILSEQFGRSDEVLSGDVFRTARKEVGAKFEKLVRPGAPIAYDGRMLSAMKRIKDEVSILPKKFQDKKLLSIIDELYDKVAPIWKRGQISIDGQRYQLLRSELSDQARTLAQKKPNASRQIDNVIRELDEMAGRSLPLAQQAEFKLARKQWRGIRVAEDAVNKEGNVMPGRLDRAIARHTPKAGGNDIYRKLSRSLDVIKDQVANSGTPARGAAMLALGSPTALLGIGALSGNVDPASIAYGLAAPLGASAALLNPRFARFANNEAAAKLAQSPIGRSIGELFLRSGGPAGLGGLSSMQSAYE